MFLDFWKERRLAWEQSGKEERGIAGKEKFHQGIHNLHMTFSSPFSWMLVCYLICIKIRESILKINDVSHIVTLCKSCTTPWYVTFCDKTRDSILKIYFSVQSYQKRAKQTIDRLEKIKRQKRNFASCFLKTTNGFSQYLCMKDNLFLQLQWKLISESSLRPAVLVSDCLVTLKCTREIPLSLPNLYWPCRRNNHE